MLRFLLVFLAVYGLTSAARAGDASAPGGSMFSSDHYVLAPGPSNTSTSANANAKPTGVHAKIGDVDMSLHMTGGAWAGGVIRP
jgi:hypothetical protein